MSVIQTIRNKYGKIAGGIIAVALVGFIISDAFNGSFGNFFRGRDSNVMKVDGIKIEPREYQDRVKEYETLYAMFNKTRNLDEATRAQMSEQVIQMIVYENVVGEQCDKLGITTSEEEKKEMIYGANPDPLIRQFQIDGQQIFINPQTNQFDPQIVKWMEKQLDEEPQKTDPTGKIREQWETVKAYVKRMSRVNKFNSLYAGSSYVPMYMMKRMAADQNSMASIKYVKIPFSTVPDAEVKVSEEEVKAYMQKHAAQYTNDQPTRTIEYVSFDILPSSADTARAIEALEAIKADLTNTTKDYKTFVNNKSDEVNSYSEAFLNKRTFMSRYADTIMGMAVGSIYGPYYENGGYRLTKVTDRKTLPDSVKMRHILVMTKSQGKEIMSDTLAKMKLDSAMTAIKAGGKFDSVVNVFSMDEQSKKNGGEYTFTLQQRVTVSKELGDYIFDGKAGDKGIVKVSNDNYSGYHYVEVIEQKGIAPSIQLATVTKLLAPSDSTVNAIYGKANEFAGKNQTVAEFDATVKKLNLDRRIGENVKVNSFSIGGLGAAREIVKWMYDHKVGDISAVFQLGDQRYVVAKLAGTQEAGIMPLTAANRPMLEQKVREEKKAEVLAKKFAGQSSLDAIAQAANVTVQAADTVMMGGGFVANLGYEPKVVGYVFNKTFQPNTVSPAIKGQGGVYFVTVGNRVMNPIGQEMMPMLAQQRGMQENQMRNQISQSLQQTLTKKAKVEYNHANF